MSTSTITIKLGTFRDCRLRVLDLRKNRRIRLRILLNIDRYILKSLRGLISKLWGKFRFSDRVCSSCQIGCIYQGFSQLLELVYQNHTNHHAPNICAAVSANSGKVTETIASSSRNVLNWYSPSVRVPTLTHSRLGSICHISPIPRSAYSVGF